MSGRNERHGAKRCARFIMGVRGCESVDIGEGGQIVWVGGGRHCEHTPHTVSARDAYSFLAHI